MLKDRIEKKYILRDEIRLSVLIVNLKLTFVRVEDGQHQVDYLQRQTKEHRPPDAGLLVRIPPGVDHHQDQGHQVGEVAGEAECGPETHLHHRSVEGVVVLHGSVGKVGEERGAFPVSHRQLRGGDGPGQAGSHQYQGRRGEREGLRLERSEDVHPVLGKRQLRSFTMLVYLYLFNIIE